MATALARPWHLRSETWRTRLGRKPLRRSSRQRAVSEKVSSPEEARNESPLDGDRGSVARARGDRRWRRKVFSLSRATDPGCAGKIDRSASLCKPERGQSERLLCRGHSGRNRDAAREDRGFESDLAHLNPAISEQARQSLRDREAAWRGEHPGGQR